MTNTNLPLSTQPQQARPTRTNLTDSASGKFIFSILLVVIIFWLHSTFTDLETGAVESVRIHALIAFLYNTFGHIPTLAILGVISLISFVLGIRQLIVERK